MGKSPQRPARGMCDGSPSPYGAHAIGVLRGHLDLERLPQGPISWAWANRLRGPRGACAIGVRYCSGPILAPARRNPTLLDRFGAHLRGYPYWIASLGPILGRNPTIGSLQGPLWGLIRSLGAHLGPLSL